MRPAQLSQEQTTRFFNLLYANTKTGWLCIWEKQSKKSLWYPVTRFQEALSEVANLALNKHDVYYGIGLYREKKSNKERGKASEVCYLPGLWMDIDCSEGTHAEKNLPTFSEAQEFIKRHLPSPSIVVNSGGGLHAYWLFKQGIEIATPSENKQVSELIQNFQNTIRQFGQQQGWKFDNTSDLARVLRIPGTLNYKNIHSPKEVILVSGVPVRYSLEDFTDFIGEHDTTANEVFIPVNQEYPPATAELILDKCNAPLCGIAKRKPQHCPNLSGLQW